MQRLRRTLEVAAWAAFFALAAAVLVLRYVVLPHIERLRPEIVERVSAIVGQPVKIGGIEAQWLGLRPQVNLTDVRIYDAEGREALVLPSVENILSWRSLMRGTLNLYALHIDGPRLVVRRDATGTLYVAGMKLVATPGEPGFSDWLFAQHDIEVRNAEIEWRDEQRAAPPLVLSSLNLRLNNEAERHSLGFAARLPEKLGTSVEVRAEVAAQDIDELRAWNGRIYAEVGYTDVAAWRPWLDYPLEFERGQAALRLWLTVAAGMPSEATADIALADVQTRLGTELPPLELASALGRISARRSGDGYELGTRQLTLARRRARAAARLCRSAPRLRCAGRGARLAARRHEPQRRRALAHLHQRRFERQRLRQLSLRRRRAGQDRCLGGAEPRRRAQPAPLPAPRRVDGREAARVARQRHPRGRGNESGAAPEGRPARVSVRRSGAGRVLGHGPRAQGRARVRARLAAHRRHRRRVQLPTQPHGHRRQERQHPRRRAARCEGKHPGSQPARAARAGERTGARRHGQLPAVPAGIAVACQRRALHRGDERGRRWPPAAQARGAAHRPAGHQGGGRIRVRRQRSGART